MNRQPWDDDLKAQARALYLADGAKLASEVTGIPIRTVQRWAVAHDWGTSPDDATGQSSDQQLASLAPDGAQDGQAAKSDGGVGHVYGPPMLEAQRDLDLAREVYRTSAARFRERKAKASEVRDAGVALAVMMDKAGKLGLPGSKSTGEWTWADNHARAEAAKPRIVMMASELAARAREDRLAQGNGQPHG